VWIGLAGSMIGMEISHSSNQESTPVLGRSPNFHINLAVRRTYATLAALWLGRQHDHTAAFKNLRQSLHLVDPIRLAWQTT